MTARSLSTLMLSGGLLLLAALPAEGQLLGEDCVFEPNTGSFRQRTVGASVQIDMVRGRIRCADGVVLRGDTIRYYEARGFAEVIGNVFYADSARTLTAVDATYYRENRQLIAAGDSATDVVVTQKDDGAMLSGLNLIYYQAGGGRIEDEVTVFGSRGEVRPRALLPPAKEDDEALADSAEVEMEPDSPLDVTADRILLRGENFFQALGRVDSFRDSVTTYSDTLVFDQVTSTLDLRGNARLVQLRDTIEGRRVLVRLPENEIREIESTGDGLLVSGDLRLESPWFRVTFLDGDVDGLWAAPLRRLVSAEEEQGEDPTAGSSETASPPLLEGAGEVDPQQAMQDSVDAAQPYAVSGETRIRADSLDVASEGGNLQQVIAVGRAYAVSARDSTLDVSALPEIAREDWMRGDTITATFGSRMEGDSTVYAIERIVASGSASSLYRLAPDSTAAAATPDSTASGAAAEADSVGSARAEPPVEDSLGVAPEEELVVLPSDAPGIHYVVAARIVLIFEDDEVRRMEVIGLEEGVHLEPRRGQGPRPATNSPGTGGVRDE